MEWWHVYLFTRLDSVVLFVCVSAVVLWAGFIGWVAMAFLFSGRETTWQEDKVIQKKMAKERCWLVIFPAVFTILALAIPTQKEAAVIYLLPKLAHSDFAKEAQQIPTDAAKLMRMKLESWISDMEPKKAGQK